MFKEKSPKKCSNVWNGDLGGGGWYFQPRPTFRICFTSKLESSVYLCVRLNVWLCVLGGVGVDFQSLSTSATMDFSPILRRTNCFDWEKSYVLLKSWWETNFERPNRLQIILSMGAYLSYLWDFWGPTRDLESILQHGVNELGFPCSRLQTIQWKEVILQCQLKIRLHHSPSKAWDYICHTGSSVCPSGWPNSTGPATPTTTGWC